MSDCLSKDRLNDLSVDIGQAEVAALVLEGKSFVVDAQQMKHGGLKVMDMHVVFDNIYAVVIDA